MTDPASAAGASQLRATPPSTIPAVRLVGAVESLWAYTAQGNEERGGDEGRPDEEQGELRAAQGESHDAPPGLCNARKIGGGGGGGEHLCEKARSEAVAEPERAGAPAVSSAFMGLADVMAVTPFNVEVP